MKYEDEKCKICEVKEEDCIYNTAILKISKFPGDDFWTLALHRHTSLPLKGEIKCLKYAVRKIFPKNVELNTYQLDPFTHFHWRVKGKPILRPKKI